MALSGANGLSGARLLGHAFNQIDINQNGNASLAEWEAFTSHYCKNIHENAKEIFRLLDPDHNGALLIQEFITLLIPTTEIIDQHKHLTERATALKRAGIDMWKKIYFLALMKNKS